MKQFTSDEIQSQFEKLPKDLQEAISSTEVHNSIVAIGNKYGLHVDQLGEMVDLVGLIMLGLSPSRGFVKNFSQEAGVRDDIASLIAKDINMEVFDKIRSSMQTIETTRESMREQNQINEARQTKAKQDISDLERIGGFNIEPTTGQDGNEATPANLPGAEDVVESHDELIAGIENPPPIRPSNYMPVKPPVATPEENHTDILVDHLLANPVAAAEQKISKTVEPPDDLPGEEPLDDQVREKPAPIVQPLEKHSGPDLYKEPIN